MTKRKSKSPATITTPVGDWPFLLNADAMAEVSSRVTSTDAHAMVADMRADETGRAHAPRLALFIRAGIAAGRGEPVDAALAHTITTALGVAEARAIILNHAPLNGE